MGGIISKPKAPTPPPQPAPTQAEVSQATSTTMDGYDSRKTKRRGRSATILTSTDRDWETSACVGAG